MGHRAFLRAGSTRTLVSLCGVRKPECGKWDGHAWVGGSAQTPRGTCPRSHPWLGGAPDGAG
eukprot:7322446-Prymnesium_polylepis.1